MEIIYPKTLEEVASKITHYHYMKENKNYCENEWYRDIEENGEIILKVETKEGICVFVRLWD